eukprot:CAMPEP_0181319488 /NCGR_PEP_ID=MMETSP1101-20121128/17602_1 /TAXON_ID=46948 /ORGANISM="Rhodomonas abbreviata, Strain Caron Lab Isolate" /LENGTH=95 /DNA_ID=CAMNT_0023427099 /DNA_START=117 /DNA_END=404 /DNA_ORIENTATION=+
MDLGRDWKGLTRIRLRRRRERRAGDGGACGTARLEGSGRQFDEINRVGRAEAAGAGMKMARERGQGKEEDHKAKGRFWFLTMMQSRRTKDGLMTD